jgi:hypothetical protein
MELGHRHVPSIEEKRVSLVGDGTARKQIGAQQRTEVDSLGGERTEVDSLGGERTEVDSLGGEISSLLVRPA